MTAPESVEGIMTLALTFRNAEHFKEISDSALALRAAVEQLVRERDLAIAHDRQPYPTADAYEKVCAARTKWQERAERAEKNLKIANGQAEHFEREWYLRGDKLDAAIALLKEAREAMQPAMKVWMGTCVWHGPMADVLARIDTFISSVQSPESSPATPSLPGKPAALPES